jgi:hypothetical protein
MENKLRKNGGPLTAGGVKYDSQKNENKGNRNKIISWSRVCWLLS